MSQSSSAKEHHTILLACDREEDRARLRQAIEPAGYPVVAVSSLETLLAATRSFSPDLVVLDLPANLLASTCRELRGALADPFVSVLVVVEKTEEAVLRESLEAGADGFLERPVDPQVLRLRIEARLFSRRFLGRLSRMAMAHPAPLMVLTPRGAILEVNPACQFLTGAARQSLLGTPLSQWVGETERTALQEALEKVMRTGEPAEIASCRIAGPEKHLRPWGVRLLRMPGREGEVLAIFSDLASRRRMEGAGEGPFAPLLYTAPLGAIATDPDGTIFFFNEAAQRISGFRQEDVVGRLRVHDCFAAGAAEDVFRRLRSEKYGGLDRMDPSVASLRSASGNEIPVMCSASLLRGPEGAEQAVLVLFEDLRERIRIEREMLEAREERIGRERREAARLVAGTASHKLNQPLTAILGLTQILSQRLGSDPSIASYLQRIHEEVERMGEVLKQLDGADELRTRTYAGKTKILDLGPEEE
ncbi:MAG: PAS domain-containing protein [Bdellovibrionota bacterium]